MKTALDIANEARNSISDFCIKDCKAKCCQRGKLLLMTDNEARTVIGINKKKYLKSGLLEYSENNFLIYNSEIKVCKNLNKKTFFCKIHKDFNRPIVCRDYPIFLVKNYVMFGQTCDAYNNGLLKKYEKEFVKVGLKII